MNVLCPKCQALFRVDPERVPSAGARVRCARCSDVFLLTRQGALPLTAAEAPARPAAPAGAARPSAPPPPPPAAPSRTAAPIAGTGPAAAPPRPAAGAPPLAAPPPPSALASTVPAAAAAPAVTPPAPAAPAAPARAAAAPARPAPAPTPTPAPPAPQTPAAAAPAGTPAGTAARPRRSFAVQDPDARAQRIARALVSDIVAYHPERRDKSLAGGTLRGEFREEIVKSWEEYVAQVGAEVARKTPHFRNALNEILAKGQSIF